MSRRKGLAKGMELEMQDPIGTLLGVNVNLDYLDGFKNTIYR